MESEAEKTVFAAASERESRTMGDMGRLIQGQAHTTALLTRPDATHRRMITCVERDSSETPRQHYNIFLI